MSTYESAVAVITGGASGIGATLATELARRGAIVVLADRQREEAEALAEKIGGSAEAIEVDVRDAEAVERLIAGVVERHGRIDYLFNNAGIGIGGEARHYTLDDWQYMVEVNLMGVIHGVHAAYPRMVAQGSGHIVNTASMAGLVPTPFTVSYGTTKHAVVGLTRALRIEAADHGVHVSVLCPGFIRTPILEGGRFGRFIEQISDDARAEMLSRANPMDPEAFAPAALDQVARNREIIILPSRWRVAWLVARLFPTLGSRIAARIYREMKSKLGGRTAT